MKLPITLISTALVLTACATPSYNYTPEVKNISRPEIGVETTASVGDIMLVQGNISNQDGIQMSNNQKISGYSFSSGFYPKTGDDDKGVYYSFVPSQSGQPTASGLGTMKKNIIVDPLKSLMVDKGSSKVCAVTVLNLRACKSNIEYLETNRTNENINSFQQTLIYSGRIGNKINIGYREFSGNSARPAFNNDVEYDLADSVIAYKGAELEISDADNRSITYIVKKNFQ